jgi:hypothetical protein
MIRPVDPISSMGLPLGWGYDSLWTSNDPTRISSWADWSGRLMVNDGKFRLKSIPNLTIPTGKNWLQSLSEFRFQVLPIVIQSRFNEHHPYGWADGPMVPAKGLQTYLSAGAFLKLGPLEVQFRPEWVTAQNDSFQNPYIRERKIDNPERMGTSTYRSYHYGQSFAKIRIGPISTGWSSENIWWGPGTKNSLLMSNNAPGISHFTFHTNRPIRTFIGTFEGQMVAGNLHYSGYFPYGTSPTLMAGDSLPVAPNLQFDSLRGIGTHSYINAIQMVWQPRWLPGLFLGFNRGVQVKGYPDRFSDYFSIVYLDKLGAATTESERNKLNRNQIVSLNMRYLFRNAHAEFYAEFAKDDHWYDWEDLLTRPLASSAWLGGFRKWYVLPGKNRLLQVFSEATVIQAPMENFMQPNVSVVSFYQHSNGTGWTNRGQVLGAGIGPGSNMTTLGMEYIHASSGVGLCWERVVYNEDLFYTRGPSLGFPNPWFRDISKHFVDWGVQLNFYQTIGRLLLTGRYNLLRTYNFQYRYAPDGVQGPFRFPGINVWSHNAEFSFCYRF